jgi:hypothetical protein
LGRSKQQIAKATIQKQGFSIKVFHRYCLATVIPAKNDRMAKNEQAIIHHRSIIAMNFCISEQQYAVKSRCTNLALKL